MSGESRTVVRAFEILDCFTAEEPTLSVAELAQRSGLNRTTTHRLVSTLRHCNVVQRDPVSGKFSLHYRLLQFGNVILRSSSLRSVAQEPMAELWKHVGETVALHVRSENARVVFMQIESQKHLRVTYPRIGESIPLNLGAPSKAILAFMKQPEIEHLLREAPLQGITENSIINSDTLYREFAKIRSLGYAVSSAERRRGVVSIAAPIFNVSEEVIASVNVVAPEPHINAEEIHGIGLRVAETGREISQRLTAIGALETQSVENQGD